MRESESGRMDEGVFWSSPSVAADRDLSSPDSGSAFMSFTEDLHSWDSEKKRISSFFHLEAQPSTASRFTSAFPVGQWRVLPVLAACGGSPSYDFRRARSLIVNGEDLH